MTTIPQLRTGSCIKQFLHTTKGPAYAHEHMNNRARKPRIPSSIRTTKTYPREDRKNRILRGDTSQLQATKNHLANPERNERPGRLGRPERHQQKHPTSVKNEHRQSSSSKNEREASKNEREATAIVRLRRGPTNQTMWAKEG